MNPMLMCDYYKTCHAQMLPKGITKSVSYFIPRKSRIPGWDKAVFFGLRGFIQQFLKEIFQKEFFDKLQYVIRMEMETVMTATMGLNEDYIERVIDLHSLGYLPIEIIALPEGTHVPMGVPMFAITNTHPDFAWLPQYLESLLSCELWHPVCVATVADQFRKLVNKEYELTSECDPFTSLSLFSMRGEESMHSATVSGAAWATRFKGCATVSTAKYLNDYYNAPIMDTIRGAPSTEHAVMCSNAAVDGDETTFIRRILTEIYPKTSFSIVLDSYDYWNTVRHILPTLKEEILAHKGCMLVRGDSGDPVDVTVDTVCALWEIFGGTVNSKGYKVLDPHVKAIYGDSITLERAGEIYCKLRKLGFAADNVALGVGSFSTQAIKVDGEYYPFTRDTFNIAMKCTYVEVDGKAYEVYKDPKGASFKRSPRGCISVSEVDGELTMKDGLSWSEVSAGYHNPENLFRTVFKDNEFVDNRDSLIQIRERMKK